MTVERAALPQTITVPIVMTPTTVREAISWKEILEIAAAVIGSFVVLTALWEWANNSHATTAGVAYVCTLLVPALIAFFGLLHLRGDMRDAFAGGFMVMYFVLVTTAVAFSAVGDFDSTTSSMRGTLVANLGSLMYVVVGFYFGASAVTKIADASIAHSAARMAAATPSAAHDAEAPSAARQ